MLVPVPAEAEVVLAFTLTGIKLAKSVLQLAPLPNVSPVCEGSKSISPPVLKKYLPALADPKSTVTL